MKFILPLVLILSGCGEIKKAMSGITGDPTEYCYVGVTYLQFPSGATVALGVDGKPLACK